MQANQSQPKASAATTAQETFSIAIYQGQTFIGFYRSFDSVPSSRERAKKCKSRDEAFGIRGNIVRSWFKTHGYNVEAIVLTNDGI